eukprot:1140398-Pelagomonas_calceolata.AAC.2
MGSTGGLAGLGWAKVSYGVSGPLSLRKERKAMAEETEDSFWKGPHLYFHSGSTSRELFPHFFEHIFSIIFMPEFKFLGSKL